MNKPIDVVVVGAGNRGGKVYSPFAKMRPDMMRIVGVAEIDPQRREEMAREYDIPAENCFVSAEEFFKHEKMADAVIIATMDRQHYAHSMAALDLGYHILLEKPIAPTVKECVEISDKAEKLGLHVVICHVLRYTTFYQLLKYCVDSGKIGDVVALHQTENVGWWHQAHSFVRGNWRNSDETTPMILQKSCHDMDIMHWLIGKKALRVTSFGSNKQFKPECAPPGAADRCLNGCKARAGCPYDCEKIYIYKDYTKAHSDVWPQNALCADVNPENLREALRTGPFGRCVYFCDNNVVDHQTVNIQFEDEVTATFMMCGHTNDQFAREIVIYGTHGEIRAAIREGGNETIEMNFYGKGTEKINVADYTTDFSGHSGGDNHMMEDFLNLVAGEPVTGNTVTAVKASVHSHKMALAAEQSRLNGGQVVEIQ